MARSLMQTVASNLTLEEANNGVWLNQNKLGGGKVKIFKYSQNIYPGCLDCLQQLQAATISNVTENICKLVDIGVCLELIQITDYGPHFHFKQVGENRKGHTSMLSSGVHFHSNKMQRTP